MKLLHLCSLAALTLTAGATVAKEMTVVITNGHPYAVELEFYSQDRDHVWPGDDQVYLLDDGEEKQVPVSCKAGENICYGAWVSGDPDTYWGVGPDDAEHCSDCCYVCADGTTESINLVE